MVMLSVLKTKNMYEAWEDLYQNKIDDYLTPDNERTQAMKTEWIKKLPKMFSVQMNRLKFEDNNAVKVLSPMNVEPIIYADRFLIQNRAQIEKIREYVQSLREKVRKLEDSLREYQQFNGEKDMNLQKILELASLFFREQGQRDVSLQKETKEIELFSPFDQSGIKQENATAVQQTIGMLTKYANQVASQTDKMEKQLEMIKQEIEKAYAGLDKNPYHL